MSGGERVEQAQSGWLSRVASRRHQSERIAKRRKERREMSKSPKL